MASGASAKLAPVGNRSALLIAATRRFVFERRDHVSQGQGIDAGEFAELVAAIRNGAAYVNVHSTKFPVGEIRSQVTPGNNE